MRRPVLIDAELAMLALAQTDLREFVSGKVDWRATRDFYCPNCEWIKGSDVKQEERHECCLYVCRRCDEIAEEREPF